MKLPIKKTDLVLDVGAGGTPYPRSDVLLDRLTGSEHRCGDPMMVDRLAVFGDASNMPFKDKSFDFIIASHVLEHIANPEIFLQELQRVGRAGYIETPSAIFERLRPFNIHCLEIIAKDDILYIHKKREPVEDGFLGSKNLLDDFSEWGTCLYDSPQLFHVRYFWSDKISFSIENPEISTDWIEKINSDSTTGDIRDGYLVGKSGWRSYGLAILNRWYKYHRAKRLEKFDINSILACPKCKGDLLMDNKTLCCQICNDVYRRTDDGVPDFTKSI